MYVYFIFILQCYVDVGMLAAEAVSKLDALEQKTAEEHTKGIHN